MSDIFISYSREDRPKAKLIAEELERRGWSVWWDRMIPAGQVFDDVIEREISAAKCIVVLWSSHSVGSRWVRSEASEGADRHILVPVLVEDVPIPLAFKRIQTADLTQWRDGVLPASFERLLADISALPGLATPAVGGQSRETGEESDNESERQSAQNVYSQTAPDTDTEQAQSEESSNGHGDQDTTANRRIGLWFGIAAALSIVILAAGFWLYTTRFVQQAPSKQRMERAEIPPPEVLSAKPVSPGAEPQPKASLFEIALEKYHDRQTVSGKVELKTNDTEEKGTVVPVSIETDIESGRHAWLISKNGCWYTEFYNASPVVITDYTLRVKMEKSSDLVVLVERNGNRIEEGSKRVTVKQGSGHHCSHFRPAHAVEEMNQSLLDSAVRRSASVDTDSRLKARSSEDGLLLKFLARHPMTTSDYIQYLGVYINGKPAAYLAWGPFVSENPYLALEFSGTDGKGRDVQIGWIDNKGKVAVSEKVRIR
ncbi:MAG: TIR domain-containing protein [Gammaproteobacteria bacterium]